VLEFKIVLSKEWIRLKLIQLPVVPAIRKMRNERIDPGGNSSRISKIQEEVAKAKEPAPEDTRQFAEK
jgi:hypothetical protein